MSSSGVYTRYINQNPGWYDGGDVMNRAVFVHGVKLGYFQVETNIGNTISECDFFHGPGMNERRRIYECHGKKAIQSVLKYVNSDYDRIVSELQKVI